MPQAHTLRRGLPLSAKPVPVPSRSLSPRALRFRCPIIPLLCLLIGLRARSLLSVVQGFVVVQGLCLLFLVRLLCPEAVGRSGNSRGWRSATVGSNSSSWACRSNRDQSGVIASATTELFRVGFPSHPSHLVVIGATRPRSLDHDPSLFRFIPQEI